MKLVDRYILKQFILSTLFGLLTFIAIFVIIDLMENLDDFLDHNVDTMVIVEYYIAFTPEIIKLMTPVAVLLSSLFTTGRLSSNNEITALKANGLSMYRYMLPLLVLSLIISGASVYFNGWVVPHANQHKFAIDRKYLQRHLESYARSHLYFQDGPRRIVYIGYFDGISKTGSRVSIQEFNDTNLITIARRFDAGQIAWDTASQRWMLLSGTERVFTKDKELTHPIKNYICSDLHFTPADIVKKQDKPDEMNYSELEDFIIKQQESGNEVARWQVDFYNKVSFPFASVIVVLFGVPFSFGKRRKGLAIQFGISVGICFLYLSFMKISEVFGYNGDLNPLLTSWLANIIFFVAAISNIVRARQ